MKLCDAEFPPADQTVQAYQSHPHPSEDYPIKCLYFKCSVRRAQLRLRCERIVWQ